MDLPEYLLLIDTAGTNTAGNEPGEWRFVLEVEGDVELDITDVEPDARGERLELLTVVRGLEALDQPSRVNVVTASRYVRTGIELGLPEWRAKDWRWESFGRLERVKHAELWQRFDRAASIHEVQCTVPSRQTKGAASPGYSSNHAPAAGDTNLQTMAYRRLDRGHGLMRRRPARNGFWGFVRGLVRG